MAWRPLPAAVEASPSNANASPAERERRNPWNFGILAALGTFGGLLKGHVVAAPSMKGAYAPWGQRRRFGINGRLLKRLTRSRLSIDRLPTSAGGAKR
jgi:hypothetical protein